MTKSFLLILFAFLVISCNSSNKLSKSSIAFEYDKKALDARTMVMFVPIRLEGIDKVFKMQFDLGLDVTAIYENNLKTILTQYPTFKKQIATEDEYSFFVHNYKLGKYYSTLNRLFILKEFGSTESYKDLSLIGSVGINEIKDKILIIDYKNKTMQIKDKMTENERSHFNFTDMEIKKKKIIINLSVNDKEEKFLFDTGNGVNIITTDKDFFTKTTHNQKELKDTVSGSSWGQAVELIGAKFQDKIVLEKEIVNTNNGMIYFTNADRIVESFNELGVKHSIGQNMFLNKAIVVDFKTNKFGILKGTK